MRKLMWLTIGFVLCCVPAVYFQLDSWLLLIGALCFASGVALCFLKAKPVRILAVVLLGVAFSAFWNWGYGAIYLQTVRLSDGKTLNAELLVTDYSFESRYGTVADGKMSLQGKSYQVRTYLERIDPLRPGDRVCGEFRFRLTVSGGQEEATYHQGKGIFLLAYAQETVTVQPCERISFRYFPVVLRQRILGLLGDAFPADTEGFARALLLGDNTKLTYEEDTAFKLSGIRHIIAVSGLHVSILFALVYMLCGKHRVLTAVFGIPVLILFAAVAGFTPSIVRACVMQCLMMLALLMKKEYDPPTALSFAILIMLLLNPMTVTSVSFQLSVGCVVGIFLFYGRIYGFLKRRFGLDGKKSIPKKLKRWAAGSVSVTLSAMSVTTPLSAAYFGSVSIVGILTNLLTLWVISFIFYGIMLACLLGAIWMPLGTLTGWVVSWPIRFVMAVSNGLSRLPLASVYTCSVYILIWLVFCYALLILMLLSKRKKPFCTAVCMLIALVICVGVAYIEPYTEDFRVTVLDVGQGQSILLESGRNRYLVDCGSEEPESAADTVASQLLSRGVYRLNGVILTHYDTDHAGAVPYLLSRIRADALYLPKIADDTAMKDTLKQNYTDKIHWIENQQVISGEWGSITLLPGADITKENESSMCILFQAADCDILITGDRDISGEKTLLESYELPRLELLIAGHHGSKNATGYLLLSKTLPKAVAISAGQDNRYGHPAPELLERLERFGCQVLRTDQQGTIVYER